jgi:hypothetical protein
VRNRRQEPANRLLNGARAFEIAGRGETGKFTREPSDRSRSAGTDLVHRFGMGVRRRRGTSLETSVIFAE